MRAVYYRRGGRRPVRRYFACIGVAVLGIGAGIAGSVLWPWGFAPAPHSLEVAQEPMPGLLLMSADMIDAATVPAASVRHFGPPAQATGTAVFVRGAQHGRRRVYVECLPAGLLLIEGQPAATWQPTSAGITDMIARALCNGHPLMAGRFIRPATAPPARARAPG